MQRLRDALPPPTALVVFEAAARHLSFTLAARELGVSPAAVSRQIRALEDDLGTALFRRLHRALRLTAAGESLQAAVGPGLARIAQTARALRRAEAGGHVSVSTTIAFASFWLMPRIPKFRDLHPDIELRMTASDPYVDPIAEGVDAAVRYGSGDWPGLMATRLFDEEIFPVCSPAYLDGRPGPAPVEDLISETLLHLDVTHHAWIDWSTWLRELGLSPPGARRGQRFNTYTILIQAAVAGQGIALGWRHMVDELLAAGSLIRPIEASLHPDSAYYLVLPEAMPVGRETAAFRDWLLEEAGLGQGPGTSAVGTRERSGPATSGSAPSPR